jgi:LacI family transcriptional regulator
MRVTLSSIGEELGVSHQVVSKTLNGGRSTVMVSKELEQRIRETARRLGYRPSAAGRSLRSGKTMTIGILVGPPEHFLLSPETLAAMVQSLSEKGYTAMLFSTAGTSEEDYLKSPLLREHAVDALIISYVHEPTARFASSVSDLPMPVLWLNRKAPRNALQVDERGAARKLAEHLLELGHRSIGFVDYSFGSLTEPLVAERLAGINEATGQAGAFVSVIQKQLARADRSAHARGWLSSGKARPTAVIVNSLSSAQIICQTALAMRLRLPEDLAVASFDNGQSHRANVPVITSAIRPDAEFGRVAAEMLFELLDCGDNHIPGQSLAFEISVGESTKNLTPTRKP